MLKANFIINQVKIMYKMRQYSCHLNMFNYSRNINHIRKEELKQMVAYSFSSNLNANNISQ